MNIFTDLETSKKLAKYIKPKEDHKFFWSKGDGFDCFKMVIVSKVENHLCPLNRPSMIPYTEKLVATYTLEQILEELNKKTWVHHIGIHFKEIGILPYKMEGELKGQTFKSKTLLQSAVDALIWVCENKHE